MALIAAHLNADLARVTPLSYVPLVLRYRHWFGGHHSGRVIVTVTLGSRTVVTLLGSHTCSFHLTCKQHCKHCSNYATFISL